jgi:2-O-methyltransferase
MKKMFLFLIVLPVMASDQIFDLIKVYFPVDSEISILEAGGHYGEHTVQMREIWKNSRIYVFEPLPSSYEVLLKNISGKGSIYTYPYALGSNIESVDFYINPNNDGSSSIGKPVEFNKNEFLDTPVKVDCITLNYWKKLHNIEKIDFMWLDMEGHELYALQSGQDVLKDVKVIFTEVDFEQVRVGSCNYKDLRAFLEKLGFKEVWKVKYGHRFGDALFVRKELLKTK